jgi:hypothetical protein
MASVKLSRAADPRADRALAELVDLGREDGADDEDLGGIARAVVQPALAFADSPPDRQRVWR